MLARVGPLRVYFPVGSRPEFWFAHDLAELFGLEYNKDAEERLMARLTELALAELVSVDSEADAVSVSTEAPNAMARVLAATFSLAVPPLPIDAALREAVRQMTEWVPPIASTYALGDLFAVPLAERQYGAVLVAAHSELEGQLMLMLDCGARSPQALSEKLDRGQGQVAGATFSSDRDIVDGRWTKVGSRDLASVGVDIPPLLIRERDHTGPVTLFLDACLGFDVWDNCAVPNDKYLVPGYVPRSKLYRRDLFERRVHELFGDDPPTVSEGPATAHVLLSYPGTAPPLPYYVGRLMQLRRRLASAVGPEVSASMTSGGCRGLLDLFLEVPDAAELARQLEAAAATLGFTKDILLICYPVFEFDSRAMLAQAAPGD